MILLGAAFVHQRYLKMYFENMDPDILNYVNTKGNGEDITMNAVVADHLAKTLEPQCAGIHVQPQNLTALEKETSMCVHVYMCACVCVCVRVGGGGNYATVTVIASKYRQLFIFYSEFQFIGVCMKQNIQLHRLYPCYTPQRSSMHSACTVKTKQLF